MRISRIASALLIVSTSAVFAASSALAVTLSNGTTLGAVPDNGRNKIVPLMSWDPKPLSVKSNGGSGRMGIAAASDFITVYRPVTPCRLVDTRGGAPITGGPFAPNTGRVIVTNGNCGIPLSDVRALSLSVTTFNYTVNNGGFISLIAPGGSVTTSNDIFNPGAQWSGTTANVPTNSAGSFTVYVAQSTIDLIIDVNGYFQDTNELDSTTQMDLNYSGVGTAFAVNVLPGNTSTALFGSAPAGTALRIGSGKLAISGATTVNGSTTAFIHEVSAGSIVGGCVNRSNISHPLLNANPNALLLAVAELNYVNNPGAGAIDPVPIDAVEYVGAGNACAANQWRLKFAANARAHDRYQLLIILP